MHHDPERASAVLIARQAGEIALASWRRLAREQIAHKSARDPVTEVDLACERFIGAELGARYPADAQLAEEAGGEERRSGRVWITDPLDGTVNYTRGHPLFAISIALVVDGEPVAGAVHLPALGETYSAARGLGAWRHRPGVPDERLRTSAVVVPIEALVATGFPYVRDRSPYNNLEAFCRMFLEVKGERRCGVASMDLALVAAGTYDGFWEPHLGAHDVAAGALLVREAGGRVTDYQGGDDWLYGRNIVATNGPLHDFLLSRMTPGFDAQARVDPGSPSVPGAPGWRA